MADYSTESYASYTKCAEWVTGLRPYFRYRDLGVKGATNGDIMVQVLRANQPCTGALGYHSHTLEFQISIMIKGSARIYLEDIGEIEVEAGDAWYQPSGIKHEVLEYSDDFETIEITLPAEFPTHDETR